MSFGRLLGIEGFADEESETYYMELRVESGPDSVEKVRIDFANRDAYVIGTSYWEVLSDVISNLNAGTEFLKKMIDEHGLGFEKDKPIDEIISDANKFVEKLRNPQRTGNVSNPFFNIQTSFK